MAAMIKTPLGPGYPVALPPCKVCGAKSSGYHYGVVTCSGCRMFFCNATKRPPDSCPRGGHCEISQHRRNCAACRYERCKQLGMKKTGRKCGRYSHSQRTDYTKETQMMELRKQISQQGNLNTALLSDGERNKKLDELIYHLNECHQRQKHNSAEFRGIVGVTERKIKEKQRIEHVMFGPMTPLSPEEHHSVYASTGVDIDGRRKFLERLMPTFESSALRFIEFANNIPGFLKLPLIDRVRILKVGATTSDIVSYYHIFNMDHLMWIDPNNNSLHIDYYEMRMYHSPPTMDLLSRCIDTLQRLDLTPEEQTIFYAYMVLLRDTPLSPEGEAILTSIIDTIEDLLFRVIKKNHDYPNRMISRMISAILLTLSTVQIWSEEYAKLMTMYPEIKCSEISKSLFVH